jgi:hypothetical protein
MPTLPSHFKISNFASDAGSTVLTSTLVIGGVLVPGAQGRPGLNGDAVGTSLSYPANGPISGHHVMRVDGAGRANYADSSTKAHANLVIGISENAAVDGAPVTVKFSGEMTEPTWNWTPALPVFVGPGGVLTQAAPASGFLLVVGIAVSATSIVVAIKQPIIL